MRSASEVEATSPASLSRLEIAIPDSNSNSGISSGIAPFWKRLMNSCSAASASA
ncbi:Uncharacterised protein [Vibrio cholerae]|uniref:Uncharacterized protein n=1 Tax=Vibrio cholerae TaxID=666 RepID=A0A655QW06_VIBCL|nr:Uncharacterised protein [Vibrio cholerae]